MKVVFLFALAVLGFALPAAAFAGAARAASFSHKDWELVCDNTGTCRAAGYQDEAAESSPASIRLTRAAGPGERVVGDVQVQGDRSWALPLRLVVDGKRLGDLRSGADAERLNARQSAMVLSALLSDKPVAFESADGQRWSVSTAGATAVLLRMDEAQGRVGTYGALVGRGNKPESSVLRAAAPPTVRAVRPLDTRIEDTKLIAPIWALVDKTTVEERCSNVLPANLRLHRLTRDKLLLSLPCSAGAYNAIGLMWMVDDRPPYVLRELDAEGQFSPDGAIHSSIKVRGVGDCWHTATWHFDGAEFVKTAENFDSLCRGFAGGAWQLPLQVSKVRMPR
ncbi:MAG: DUF1176 domain-containing protein [Variovorax sp.]